MSFRATHSVFRGSLSNDSNGSVVLRLLQNKDDQRHGETILLHWILPLVPAETLMENCNFEWSNFRGSVQSFQAVHKIRWYRICQDTITQRLKTDNVLVYIEIFYNPNRQQVRSGTPLPAEFERQQKVKTMCAESSGLNRVYKV